MRVGTSLFAGFLILSSYCMQSCTRSTDDVWDDTKSASRHVGRGFSALGGKHGESRAVHCKEDFMPIDDVCQPYDSYISSDFTPLQTHKIPMN